jgi:alkanesulfonate monooxygenase SsuD/methylene tetrahydromethanopterin reductase-like flavin-dependent oxidoreductase (luciferase family)
LLQKKERFIRLEEGLEVISKLLRSDAPVNFSGKYFNLNDGILLPRPIRPGGPPILVGGNGKNRTLPLAARFAQEWNAVYLPPDEVSAINAQLDTYIEREGRKTQDVRRSLMTGCVFGRNQAEVEQNAFDWSHGQHSIADMRKHGLVVGTAPEIIEQCQQFAKAGVQRVMLQWLGLDDITGLEAMADGILDALSG